MHRDWFGASASVLHERFQTWRELGAFQRIMLKLVKRRSIRTRWVKKASNWLALVQFACAHILFTLGSQ